MRAGGIRESVMLLSAYHSVMKIILRKRVMHVRNPITQCANLSPCSLSSHPHWHALILFIVVMDHLISVCCVIVTAGMMAQNRTRDVLLARLQAISVEQPEHKLLLYNTGTVFFHP